MAKKKKEPQNPTAKGLPKNPEFQAFAAFTSAIMQVPKADVARMWQEERAAREQTEPTEGEALDC